MSRPNWGSLKPGYFIQTHYETGAGLQRVTLGTDGAWYVATNSPRVFGSLLAARAFARTLAPLHSDCPMEIKGPQGAVRAVVSGRDSGAICALIQ